MIPVTTFAGRRVAVFGLGASGNATALALMAGGAEVAAWDDGAASRAAAAKAGVPVVDLDGADWTQFAALVLAPGVPLTHPAPHSTVQKARAAGIEVIGDIELFCRERGKSCPDAPFIAITGTNGKSTTTALIAHILKSTGRDVQMGGNIGVPILALEPPARDRFHVVEMSSFQIDLTPSLKPTIGVLLNITPDHLDRHGPADNPDLAMRNYTAIKERLVRASDRAVICIDDDKTQRIAAGLAQASPSKVAPFSCLGRPWTAAAVTMTSLESVPGYAPPICLEPTMQLHGVASLRGDHNKQNAIAASLAAYIAEPNGELHLWQRIVSRLPSYPGLPHRMELVGWMHKNGGRVLFINDSKATNADSTEKALASFERDIFWILGGKPKEGGIKPLDAYFSRIAKAFLIGEASDDFAATLDGRVPFERCVTLDVALQKATAAAAASPGPEPVVLLSPACASYDQFRSFEHRGNAFRTMVQALPGIATGPAAP